MLRKIFTSKYTFANARLYTWTDTVSTPEKINLPEGVKKLSCGPNHTAIIGDSGNLYTYGTGESGQLGHNNTKNVSAPKVVQFFANKNIKIKDAVCGQKHTIVLTEKGQVYTFGWGGRKLNFFYRIFTNPVGPLGHGDNKMVTIPTLVKKLKSAFPIERITAGRAFNMVFNNEGEVYNWGNGEYGVYGDGNNKNYNQPVKNTFFEYLLDQNKIKLKKVKSCQSFSVALMTDDKLYGWGSNESGQMGIKAEIGIQIYETVNFVSEVIREGYEDKKVINFDVSEDTLVFQLDNGQLWQSGGKLVYKPQRVPVDEKPKLFSAGRKSYAFVTADNIIYSKNNFIKLKDQDLKTGIQKADGAQIFGGKIVGLGGEYQTRYAIIQ